MNKELKYFNRFINDILPGVSYDPKNKPKVMGDHIAYMLARTHSMFKWEGLPDSIPDRIPELFLQINGHICFTEVDGDLYIFTGGLGGKPDAYYMPTIYTVANPALNFNKSLTIGEDCVVMPNDTMYLGLMPLYSRYAAAMTETELSIMIASVNARICEIISAADDNTKASAEMYLKHVYDGDLGVIAEQVFLDGVKVHTCGAGGSHTVIEDLIELEQYQKASWYNEIGLNANYNMKRESINAGESQLNNDALLPLVDDMLKVRQDAITKVNEKYGTEIAINLASSWEDNEIEIEQEHSEDKAEEDKAPADDPIVEEGDKDNGTEKNK